MICLLFTVILEISRGQPQRFRGSAASAHDSTNQVDRVWQLGAATLRGTATRTLPRSNQSANVNRLTLVAVVGRERTSPGPSAIVPHYAIRRQAGYLRRSDLQPGG